MARINRIDSSHDIGKPCKLSLITKTYAVDLIGSMTEVETSTELYGHIRSVYSTEFASAGENGIKPASIFTIWESEYNGAEELISNSERYSVYRTYVRRDGRIELYTEKKVGNE